MVFACGNHKVVGFRLLEDEPHALDIVLGIAPVAQRVQVTQIELVLITLCNTSGSQCNLTGHEGLTAALTLVVEENAVAAEHVV